MTSVDLHTLTGAYAVGALTGREAVAFDRHLARCDACAQEVRELRETAARLALAVAEVPPAGLRTRVMAALPEVRQLPPETSGGRRAPVTVLPLTAGRRWRQRLPYLAVAACLALAGVATGVAVNARDQVNAQHDRTARVERQTEALSALVAAPDADFHTGGLTDGGTATVVASASLERTALLYHGLPALTGAKVYELWYSRGGTMVPAGLLESDRTTGSALLNGHPEGADGVGLTVEPAGGSPAPTTTALGVIPL
jgi:anti-sigma-K factor RskA